MTDRDTFAAAALTGLLAQGDDGSFSEESYARAAYRWADAMLRERGTAVSDNCGTGNQREMKCPVTKPMPAFVSGSGSVTPVPYAQSDEKRVDWHMSGATTHDAAPEARGDARGCAASATTIDQERFNAAVMNWISETTAMLMCGTLGKAAEQILSDACDKCWVAYNKDSTNHDAVPAAIAPVDRLVRLGATDRESVGTDKAEPLTRDCGTGNTDARLAALEELVSLDQKLELEYGLTGNPMIKAQRNNEST